MKKKRDFWPLAKDFSQRFPHKISSLQATKESVGVLGIAFGKMFWSSEDRVRARFHYAESRQNKPQVNLWRKS